MLKLKAGDLRQKGDEVRHIDLNGDGFDCPGYYFSCGHSMSFAEEHPRKVRKPTPGPWKPVSLIGHKILQSDLMVFEFRRHD
jgi:hypothetical protein